MYGIDGAAQYETYQGRLLRAISADAQSDYETYVATQGCGVVVGIVGIVVFIVGLASEQKKRDPYQCRNCGTPITYIHQYSRWYCPRCQIYLPESGNTGNNGLNQDHNQHNKRQLPPPPPSEGKRPQPKKRPPPPPPED